MIILHMYLGGGTDVDVAVDRSTYDKKFMGLLIMALTVPAIIMYKMLFISYLVVCFFCSKKKNYYKKFFLDFSEKKKIP